jgi:hypothetical protein
MFYSLGAEWVISGEDGTGRVISGRRALGAAVAAGALALLAPACGSSPPPAFHPANKNSAPTSSPAASAPWPGKARWVYDPLPADSQQAMLIQLDRAFHTAFYDAIYTRGADKRWMSYISDPSVVKSMTQLLKQDIAANRGYRGAEIITHSTVRTDRNISGYVVDSCMDDSKFQPIDTRTGTVVSRNPSVDGPVREEQQDVFTEVNGVWKLNTPDTFTDTEGFALVEPKEC